MLQCFKNDFFLKITQSSTFAQIFKDFRGYLPLFTKKNIEHSTPFASSIQRITRSEVCSPWYTFYVVLCCANIQIYMVGSYTCVLNANLLHPAVFEPKVWNSDVLQHPQRHTSMVICWLLLLNKWW